MSAQAKTTCARTLLFGALLSAIALTSVYAYQPDEETQATTMTPYQASIPVPTLHGDFVVLEQTQVELAKMAKDDPRLKIEQDFLGLKQLKSDMAPSQIKRRFALGMKELRTPQSELIKP